MGVSEGGNGEVCAASSKRESALSPLVLSLSPAERRVFVAVFWIYGLQHRIVAARRGVGEYIEK